MKKLNNSKKLIVSQKEYPKANAEEFVKMVEDLKEQGWNGTDEEFVDRMEELQEDEEEIE